MIADVQNQKLEEVPPRDRRMDARSYLERGLKKSRANISFRRGCGASWRRRRQAISRASCSPINGFLRSRWADCWGCWPSRSTRGKAASASSAAATSANVARRKLAGRKHMRCGPPDKVNRTFVRCRGSCSGERSEHPFLELGIGAQRRAAKGPLAPTALSEPRPSAEGDSSLSAWGPLVFFAVVEEQLGLNGGTMQS